MKNTAAIQDKLNLLYTLQKEQEFQLTQGISKLSGVFTPVNLITELIGAVTQKSNETSHSETNNYSPLWDKLTNQVGITSPLAKSTIHLVLDQLVTKWLQNEQNKNPVTEEKERKSALMDHSLNHF
ncbi:MAG: hypothetical protein RLZZ211_970 [Bacteroidota bacterium]|jgi:hypothetical protein